jgi:glc operon protein GlcG
MGSVAACYRLTHEGAMKALQACIDHATKINAPVTISICDASGALLACCRMDGSFLLSIESSLNKAITAAAISKPTGLGEDMLSIKLGLATFGRQTIGLKGGVPIIVDGQVIGGIGAGSATGDQDREISIAGLKAIDGARVDFDPPIAHSI